MEEMKRMHHKDNHNKGVGINDSEVQEKRADLTDVYENLNLYNVPISGYEFGERC